MFLLFTIFTGGYLIMILNLLYFSVTLFILSLLGLVFGILGIYAYNKNKSVGGKKISWFSTIIGALIVILSGIMLFSNTFL